MNNIVAVHGVWNHRRGLSPSAAARNLADEWSDALFGGRFGPLPDATVVHGAYYAHRLRPVGAQAGDEELEHLSPLGQELVSLWLDQVDPAVAAAQGRLTRNLRQDIARYATRLGHNRWIFERAVTLVFGEVARYLDPDSPARIQARTEVAEAIAAANRGGRTTVVAHSLGTVVTYETLHAYPQLKVDHLITLGSPLALPHAVFHRLSPTPAPRGSRPANTQRWTNIADVGDIVAVPPQGVRDSFNGVDHNVETAIHLIDFHTAGGYLRTDAVAQALHRLANGSGPGTGPA
ncbi:hypothetical protein Ait01nite_081880 [Actinoplanes italicus]|uniref:Serine peptidase n=1 Tax=Actinoplanes italicus TaxID=113567 RepID=A0A2T0K387_9ACTN|nr:serine peptidase [Actinoplanes italicus]PRX17301.1 hypothetical protein CLV67_11677 [Actinoplanes italicus]GIE35143.1 hypothetical protein Ait01nite_081880 [Actinoplanes italicus]